MGPRSRQLRQQKLPPRPPPPRVRCGGSTTGELIELDVGEDENPLELFKHPYAYMPLRGHPGRAIRQAGLAAA